MSLWLGYVLRQHQRIDAVSEVLMATRHWFGLYAGFAGAAALVNKYEELRRRRESVFAAVLPSSYEERQRKDRVGAGVSATMAGGVWVAMGWWEPPWLALASLAYALAVVMVVVALFNQSRAIHELFQEVEAR